jgi:DNA (cytosine-5)-methyltransferase 1
MHLQKTVESQLETRIMVAPVSEFLAHLDRQPKNPFHEIDLIAGGPPCQGFSLAGKRNRDDNRNQLPWQFLQAVEKCKPKFVVIENVIGMKHRFKEDSLSPFESLALALESTKPGYVVQRIEANAMHYGAAQSRPRLLLIAVRFDIAERLEILSTNAIWASKFVDEINDEIPQLAPIPTSASGNAVTVGEALSDLIYGRNSPYLEALNGGQFGQKNLSKQSNNEKRTHREPTKERFALYHLISKYNLPTGLISHNSAKIDDENALTLFEALPFPLRRADGQNLARNREELLLKFRTYKTFKQSQRVVRLDRPSPTIVTAADDYIHPIEERVFSVRELARFQGFPDWFRFLSKATTGGLNRRVEVPQYTQVGNAVSPFVSLAIGKLVNSKMEDLHA